MPHSRKRLGRIDDHETANTDISQSLETANTDISQYLETANTDISAFLESNPDDAAALVLRDKVLICTLHMAYV